MKNRSYFINYSEKKILCITLFRSYLKLKCTVHVFRQYPYMIQCFLPLVIPQVAVKFDAWARTDPMRWRLVRHRHTSNDKNEILI